MNFWVVFLSKAIKVVNGSMLYRSPSSEDRLDGTGRTNVSVDVFSSWPNGNYKIILGLYDDLDDNIAKVNVSSESNFRYFTHNVENF